MTSDLEQKALFALRMILKNPEATWNGQEQKSAVMASLELKTDVFVIMATGAGKSYVALIPPMIEQNKVTVLVLPLLSLIQDYQRRLDDIPLEYETYPSHTRGKLEGSANLVIVSLDMTKQKHWAIALQELHNRKPVARLVIDEAHFAMTHSDFRKVCKNLYDLRIFPMQFGLLSATITPEMETHLKDAVGLLPGATCIRTSTDRPELQYIIETFANKKEVYKRTEALYGQHLQNFGDKDRALIFVPYVDFGEMISKALHCPNYSGQLSHSERSAAYNHWISGKSKVMVCTSAFGAGNDYPQVRLVIHAGTPCQMIDLTQELSRAGRDKIHSYCYILPTKSTSKPTPDPSKPDFGGRVKAWELAFNTTGCIRFLITKFNDGQGVYCKDSSKALLCSLCQLSKGQKGQAPKPGAAFKGKKRQAPEPGAAFVEAVERAKKRKILESNHDSAYIEAFQKALSQFSKICAFCSVFDKDIAYHKISQCSTLKFDVEKIDFHTYCQWQKKICYNTKHHPSVCYHCHIPQCDDVLHGTYESEAKGCENPDVVGPVAFAVFHIPTFKEKAEKYFRTKWPTSEVYLEWLNGPPIANQKTNTSAVFLWYADYSRQ